MCVTSLSLQSLLHLLVLSELKGHFLLSPKMSLYKNIDTYSQGQGRFIKQRKQWATAGWPGEEGGRKRGDVTFRVTYHMKHGPLPFVCYYFESTL